MKTGFLVRMALVGALGLAGCARQSRDTFQGYVEGEFVQVATAEAGRLEDLQVAKGDRAEAGAPLFALDAALRVQPELLEALRKLLGEERVCLASLESPHFLARSQQVGLSGAALAGVAQVLRALDYDYRSSGKRLGNCCIVEYDCSPSLGLSVCDIYNPND